MDIAERIDRGRRAIARAKLRGQDTTAWERRLRELFDEAGREPKGEGVGPWMLWEWRRISIPDWRHKLAVATVAGRRQDERYARWMLREVLLDPDYSEDQP